MRMYMCYICISQCRGEILCHEWLEICQIVKWLVEMLLFEVKVQEISY